MVCKFFTWPHFCILCGNTLEASGRLGSYPVRAVKITKRWLRRTTDDKVCEKAIQLAVNQLTRLEDSTTSHSAHSAAASSPPPPPFSPFLFCWLAIWLRHIEVRVRSNMQSSRSGNLELAQLQVRHQSLLCREMPFIGRMRESRCGREEVILVLSAFSSRFVLVSLCAPPVSGTFGLSIQSIKSTRLMLPWIARYQQWIILT